MPKRADRLLPEVAAESFERYVRGQWMTLYKSVHSIELDLHELFATQLAETELDGVRPIDFIEGWMRWKAGRRGFGYVILDTTKVVESSDLARNGLHLGLLRIVGRGSDFRIHRIAPDRLHYRRFDNGGCLRLPDVRGRGPVDGRHAEFARPIIERLLSEILDLSPTSAIPDRWITHEFVQRDVSSWTLRQASGLIRDARRDWPAERQVRWIAELRCYLIHLGGGGLSEESAPPAEDAEALAGLAA